MSENIKLSDDFLKKYRDAESPLDSLGRFIFYRTYSRWIEEQGRMERWWECVRRSVDYNCSLAETSDEEAQELFDNMYNMRQFIAGRTLWIGGTEMARRYPLSNYNCAFIVMDDIDCFREIFYMLMLGCGVGIRILKRDAERLPKFRSNFEVTHMPYAPVEAGKRKDNTSLEFTGSESAIIRAGDSREGWTGALDAFIRLCTQNEYKGIRQIAFDYDSVRRKGERLKTFGGVASGHKTLLDMISKIEAIIKSGAGSENDSRQLQPVELLDILNIIGENVSVGGVRRAAQMIMFDGDDDECIAAKSELYSMNSGELELNADVGHRRMSNNSIFYERRPSDEELDRHFDMIRLSGEPGFINAKAARIRRKNFQGLNPCGEVLLDSRGVCNLTTVNVYAFVNAEGQLDEEALSKAQRLSVRAACRMANAQLELSRWDYVSRRDRLVGCSLTGWQDMVNAASLAYKDQVRLLRELRMIAHSEATEYSHRLGKKAPLLVTTVKPEGTLSQMAGVSSGVHYAHSQHYIRRIRISKDDPMTRLYKEKGYVVSDDDTQGLCCVEFPVRSQPGKTKLDVNAIDQLENYKLFMKNYVDHNTSITVHVRKSEWNGVKEWVRSNWNEVVALSFMPLEEELYPLMPYEAITNTEYDERVFGIAVVKERDLERLERFKTMPMECCSIE
ncbi:adenosylcobalamin-dependent ribonucleoside-triphosphate reductase RtpR [Peptoclostridium acidaminophilum DSM 3953]|uniref:Adenosylcobalamin-dependent ribonucleoside-triphosphate reductase n=1 Tax=Peptoclostridium acidaminophilum DSM 3953 TaxID=1286171 RepID=W8T140_PEPAC|nr:ribonucleoside-triphosphate reductase, adenosylcobalamin-dependent [Peptoclostridium acidaminophilum]AHM55449.1 adenosylcobalamin-dependent ribonucleoside-triphosphate reductase RtpR [Peptoclostridium acidaminophilum DSM 3953]